MAAYPRQIRKEFDLNRDTTRQMIHNSPYHELEQGLVKWIRTVREQKIESFRVLSQLFNDKYSLGENHNSAGFIKLELEFILSNYS